MSATLGELGNTCLGTFTLADLASKGHRGTRVFSLASLCALCVCVCVLFVCVCALCVCARVCALCVCVCVLFVCVLFTCSLHCSC